MERTVEDYFSSIPRERRGRLEALHRLIVGSFPDVCVDMKYGIPTYHVGAGWVALANRKHYVSLHTCGYHHIESFKARQPNIKTGKGCINFKDSDELPLDDIAAVVSHAMRHPKGHAV